VRRCAGARRGVRLDSPPAILHRGAHAADRACGHFSNSYLDIPPTLELTNESIRAISVDLKVNGKTSLFVLLADDGTVNRMGTGTADNTERELYIGLAEEPLFEQLRDMVQPDWMSLQGEYDIPEKEGLPCTLTILIAFGAGQEVGWRFRYGSESDGPPDDICEFVAAADRLTDPWYEHQKLLVRSLKRAKPWWKIW